MEKMIALFERKMIKGYYKDRQKLRKLFCGLFYNINISKMRMGGRN